jgi:hypothetical protein
MHAFLNLYVARQISETSLFKARVYQLFWFETFFPINVSRGKSWWQQESQLSISCFVPDRGSAKKDLESKIGYWSIISVKKLTKQGILLPERYAW